jgi:hypothetical protein
MEILYSSRTTSEYVALEAELDVLRILRNDLAVSDAAMRAIGELAGHTYGYHRVPLTDSPIRSRCRARRHCGAQRDAHFDRLVEVLALHGLQPPGS